MNEGPITLTILSGQTDSAALSTLLSAGQLKILKGFGKRLAVTAPAAVTGTINIQTTGSEASSTWSTVQINGTDIAIAAAKTNLFPLSDMHDLRIHSNSAEGADRAFVLNFQVDVIL